MGPLLSQGLFSIHRFLPPYSKAVIYLMPKEKKKATISSDAFIIWASLSKSSFSSFLWYHFPKLYIYFFFFVKITLLKYLPLSRQKISGKLDHVKISSNCTLVVLAHCLVLSINSVSNL